MGSDKTSDGEKSLDLIGEALLEQAEGLIWALLDDEIETTDLKRLESLIQAHEQVRQRYVDCVQMHTDLHQHFDATKTPQTTDTLPESPVLGTLGDLRPAADTWPPVAE